MSFWPRPEGDLNSEVPLYVILAVVSLRSTSHRYVSIELLHLLTDNIWVVSMHRSHSTVSIIWECS